MADRNLELALHIKTLVEGAKSIEELSDQLVELGREAKAVEAPADTLGAHLQQAASAAKQADTALDSAAAATADVGRAARGSNDPLAQLRRCMADLAAQRNPMDEFNQGLTKTERAVRPVPGWLEQLKGMAAQLAATFLTAKTALDLNDRFTALERGFTAVTGSAEQTQDALNFIRDVADHLGVGVLGLGQDFLKLTAAAKGTQLEGAATEQIFSSLTSALTTVGASTQDVQNALNAVAQMMSKGVISAEELRGQLGDVLPGAAQQAAAALGVSNAEFNKMLESGQVLASEFLPKFAAQLDKTMGGGQARVESFSASWQRLLNQLTDLATGPVGTGLTKFLSATTDGLGILARGAGAAADVVGAAGKAIGGFAAGEATEAARDLGQAMVDASVKLFGFRTEAEVTKERQKQMAEELRSLTPEIDRFQAAVDRQELKALPESLQAAIAEFQKTGNAANATTLAVQAFMAAAAQNLTLDGILKLATGLRAVGNEAKGAGAQITTALGEQLSKLTDEQLTALERQARAAMAAASQGSDASRKAFAELGQVIEGVVLARMQRLGVDGPEALTGISQAAADVIADFTALAGKSTLSADAIRLAFAAALKKLDNPAELTAFANRIEALGRAGQLTGGQVAEALALIRQRARETADDSAYETIRQALTAIHEEAYKTISAEEALLQAQRNEAQSALELARVKGNEYQARQQIVRVAEIEARLAQLNAEKKAVEARIAVDVVAAIQKEIAAKQAVGEIIGEVDMTRLKAATTAMNVAAIEAQAAGLVAEAEAKKAAAIQLSRLGFDEATKTANQYGKTMQRVAGFVEQVTESMREEAEANQEATAAAEEHQARLKELAAKGEFLSNIINGWARRLEELSPAARQAFDGFAQAVKPAEMSLDQLQSKMEANNQQIAKLSGNMTSVAGSLDALYSGIALWATKTANKALEIEQAFLGQKETILQATEALEHYAKTGKYTADVQQAMTLAAGDSIQQFDLLDQQDLARLRSALDSANEKLQEMRHETQSARDHLAELNAELLEARGQDQKANLLRQELDYQQQLAEIEAKRVAAQVAGNWELVAILEQQKAVLEAINRAKLAAIDADSRGSSGSSGSSGGSGGSGSGKGNTINIHVDGKDLLSEEQIRAKVVPVLNRITQLRA